MSWLRPDLADPFAEGPEPIGPELEEFVSLLAAKHGRELDDASSWWTDPDSPVWPRIFRWFPGLTRESVLKDPMTADQAMRELRMCAVCREGEPDGRGGSHECLLGKEPWEGDVLHPGGSAKAYLVYRSLSAGDGAEPRYEWCKRYCRSKQHRANEIAELEGRMREIGGGIRGVEVHT